MTKPEIKIFENTGELAANIAGKLEQEINQAAADHKIFNLAISGGSTPNPLFKLLGGDYYKNSIQWDYLHIYWVDERCVAGDEPESNYGNAFQLWLKNVPLPLKNIHRIIGEAEPEIETIRYQEEIKANLPEDNQGIPVFDLIILGIGNDGHTASVFPGAFGILNSDSVSVVAEHPETGQKRITLTPKTINNAKRVFFIVSGKEKAKIITEILTDSDKKGDYPACHINPVKGDLYWFLDKEAGSLIVNGQMTIDN